LSGPRFGRLLEEARKLFDYIIIDAPPLGVFTDANLLINRADAALLVLRAGITRYSVVDRLLEHIPRERMLGVVLNRAQAKSVDPYHYNRSRIHAAPPIVTEPEFKDAAGEDRPEMIYTEEDGGS